MATSPNYAWAEPDNSSLVKNGAQDIRALGDAIDTSVWNVGYGQAGKNKLINANFAIAQRGTTFAAAHFNAGNLYTLDRWQNFWDNVPTSVTVSQQTFTPGAAPVAGYEGAFFYRSLITTVGSCTIWRTRQKIEDVRIFAGQTAIVSFWAKADTTRNVTVTLGQNFGSGGSGDVSATPTTTDTLALTTSWARYSVTYTVPSISGKTIGTGSSLILSFIQAVAAGSTLDLWGVQAEYGSKATPFQLAGGGDPQSELAMCQRYYVRFTGSANGMLATQGGSTSTTSAVCTIALPVEMRVIPTSIDSGGTIALTQFTSSATVTALTLQDRSTNKSGSVTATTASHTANTFSILRQSSDANAYLAFSAEL